MNREEKEAWMLENAGTHLLAPKGWCIDCPRPDLVFGLALLTLIFANPNLSSFGLNDDLLPM